MSIAKTSYIFIWILLFNLFVSTSHASNYDPSVEVLQRNLSLLNYKPGPADGLWGRKTQQSYETFLEENNLLLPKNPKSFSIKEVTEVRLTKIKNNLIKRDHLKQPLNIRDAAHLLRRTGFGAHPVEVNQLLNRTRAEAIIKILEGISTQDELPVPDFMNKKTPPKFMGDSIDNYDDYMNSKKEQLQAWWLKQMLTTSIPQSEKLTLFWHNHFVSSYEGTDWNNYTLFLQNKTFRKYGFTNFKLLTKLMLSDAALLKYLDNDENHKDNPNENLARELFELFTLGEGNYSEETLKEAARTLTGYSFNRINFSPYFYKENHDFGQKALFGASGNFDPYDLIDLIFEQPTASKYITSKFWKLYISELNPPNAELDAIASKFRESDFDLVFLISELLASKSFWAEENRGTIVKSPIDLLVGMIRSTGHSTKLTPLLSNKTALLGQSLFEHPNVAGWPGGADWISSTRLLTRGAEIKSFLESFEENSSLEEEKVTKVNAKNLMEVKNVDYYSANVWDRSFLPDSDRGGMTILLDSPDLTDHYSKFLYFDLGFNRSGKVFFCIVRPHTVSYFYEDLAGWFNNDLKNNYGQCIHAPEQTKLMNMLQTMNRKDIMRVDLVCNFLSSQKIKNWFKSGKAYPTSKTVKKSLGNEKILQFWASTETYRKLDSLGKNCSSVTRTFLTKDDPTSNKNANGDDTSYSTNELVIDTVRIRWLNKKTKDNNYINIDLGLHDILFNNLRKAGMAFEFLVLLNEPSHKRFQLKFRKYLCDNGCYGDNEYKQLIKHMHSPPTRRGDWDGFYSLTERDRTFVAALWLALPELIDHAVNVSGSHIQEKYIPHLEENYWKNELDHLKRMTLNSPYKKYVPNFKLTITEETYPKGDTMNSMMTTNMTTPVSLTLDQNIATKNKDDFLNKVEKLEIDIEKELANLLLSINPVTNLSDSDRIRALFEDPAFQLN